MATQSSALPRARYMNIRDFCLSFGLSRSGVYRALAEGRLRAVKLGGRTLLDVNHADAAFAALPEVRIGGRAAA